MYKKIENNLRKLNPLSNNFLRLTIVSLELSWMINHPSDNLKFNNLTQIKIKIKRKLFVFSFTHLF